MLMRHTKDVKRFWGKVNKAGDCWEWTAGVDKDGYGKFSVRKQHKRAHRIAWELANGPIPRGMFVCHICDNPGCCRPDHLFLGTPADNMIDRGNKDRTIKGEAHGGAKLNENDVLRIRDMLRCGANGAEIARTFGVARSHIWRIKHKKKWAHISG